MKQVDLHSLPPCSLSTDCLRLLDDLDEAGITQKLGQVSFTEDIQDERLLGQLRLHLPNCPTCTVILAQARRVRSQQRAALRDLLIESESRVPSTTSQIHAAISREKKARSEPPPKRKDHDLQEIVMAPAAPKLNGKHKHPVEPPSPSRSGRLLGNALSLATVAAIILSAVGLFNHMFIRPASTGNKVVNTHGWDSVVIGLTEKSAADATKRITTIYNYNPASRKNEQLAPPIQASAVQLDSVTHDGMNLLYQYSSSGHIQYSTLEPLQNTGFFYQQNDDTVGSAIWMDRYHALISSVINGVVEVDTQTGQSNPVLPSLKTQRLTFYRAPYLYFVGAEDSALGALYRVNVTYASSSPRQVTLSSLGSTYWLSPDGTTVFYADKGPAGERAIYAVGSNGTNSRILHRGDVIPIGYADNDALMFMQEVNGKFQVVRMGATPQQKEQVVLDNAAPGATSLCGPEVAAGKTPICDRNIALAPYGYGLILNAYYPDYSHAVLYDDLTTGKSSVLLKFDSEAQVQVQLPGWDRIPVSRTTPSSLHHRDSEPVGIVIIYCHSNGH